ncbi:MAG: HlyD family efflux transporter periplasmic adaptor subunit [Bryobacteraceae bacterium]
MKRGPMVRQVRGLGTLVPEEILWIPAPADGRVESILVRPGAPVGRDTVLVVLRNPEMELAALDAEYQVKAAEAKYTDLKVRLASDRLNQQAEVAKIESEYKQARLKADADEALGKLGLLASLQTKISVSAAEELAHRHQMEKKRLSIGVESVDAQLAVQRAEVDKLRALHILKRSQLEALKVRAGAAGVLQELPVEVGQRVTAGTILAKVAQPERLKAELKIAETQAKDIQLGQRCSIDTRNGVIDGRVMRIDPSVKEGTVTVDVKLEGSLPAGARPDLSVDGTVELERLEDVVYVGRPTSGQPNSTITLFRVSVDGKNATRVQVKLGRGSVTTIEVLEGLQSGDQVILSDMTTWDSYDRIRLQ